MSKTKAARRRDAAEEVCYTLLLMMALGGLEIPQEWKDLLAEPFGTWAALAVETGELEP